MLTSTSEKVLEGMVGIMRDRNWHVHKERGVAATCGVALLNILPVLKVVVCFSEGFHGQWFSTQVNEQLGAVRSRRSKNPSCRR